MALGFIKLATIAGTDAVSFLNRARRPLHLSSMQSFARVMPRVVPRIMTSSAFSTFSPEQALLCESFSSLQFTSVHFSSSMTATLIHLPPMKQLLVTCASRTIYRSRSQL